MRIKTAKDFLNNEMHKPNYQVTTTDGKSYWISRSVAVLAAVVSQVQDKWYILVNKRGEGCTDFQGCWNIPCGYLDWGETCQEACSREVHEECGIDIVPNMFKLMGVESSPETSSSQNVTIRHIAVVHPDIMLEQTTDSFSEKNEIAGIKWILFDDADNYEWAFNHRQLLDIIASYLKKQY